MKVPEGLISEGEIFASTGANGLESEDGNPPPTAL